MIVLLKSQKWRLLNENVEWYQGGIVEQSNDLAIAKRCRRNQAHTYLDYQQVWTLN